MTRRLISAVLLSLCILPCVRPAAARPGDDDRFLLLDRTLRPSLVRVQTIGPTSVRVSDDQSGGKEREVPLADVAALAPGWWRPGTEGSELAWARPDTAQARRQPPAGLGMLLLADGRRLVGRLSYEAPPEHIGWDHPQLARSEFRLDDVRVIQLVNLSAAQRAPAAKATGDRVVMTNGDVVSGFVDAVGAQVKLETEGKRVDLSFKQVARVELANPPKSATGLRLWLQDGSVFGARGFAAPTGAGELRLELDTAATSGAKGAAAPPQVALALGDVVALAGDAGRLVPLASLPFAEQKGLGERRFAEPAQLRWRGEVLHEGWRDALAPGTPCPPLDTPDIELPGPMQVEWQLPAGATRLAGWAEIPTEARLWGELTLVIEGVGRDGKATPLAQEALNSSRPAVEFNVAFPRPAPERLRISVQEGSRGPIQDRVVLRRTLLLLDPAAR